MIEIERKFVLKDLPWAHEEGPGSLLETYRITQFYGDGNLRYRKEGKSVKRKDIRYIKMLKTSTEEPGTSFEGTLIDITPEEYSLALLKAGNNVIHKQRSVFTTVDPKIVLEIDQFIDWKFIMMEVELPSIDYKIVIPSNVQIQMLCEVTGLKQFSNKELLGGSKRNYESYK